MIATDKQHDKIFDGIRGFAFFIVLVMHGFAVCYDGAQTYLQGGGKYGVWLFFVLSSFLLTKNYILRNKSKIDYALGRIVRIVPLYLIACSIYLLSGLVSIESTDLAKMILIQYGPIHLWTIPVEFYFYVYLLAIWLMPKIIARDIIFATSAALSIFALSLTTKDQNSTNTFWYLPSFFIGYVLARAWEKIPEIKYGTLLSASVILVFVIATPGTLYFLFKTQPSPYLMNMYAPLSVAWGLFIVAICKSPPNVMNKALSCPAFIFLGRVSYSGYLFHWLVMVKVEEIAGSGAVSVALSIFLSLCAAFASYVAIEKPSFRIRDALLNKLKSKSNQLQPGAS